MTVTFEQARQAVAASWPDYDLAPYGFEGANAWFVLLLPETMGGRIAAVSKDVGDVNWINENADEYTEENLVGEDEPAPAALATLAASRERLAVLDRTYKRDKDGRFGSTGTHQRRGDAAQKEGELIDSMPSYDVAIRQAEMARPGLRRGEAQAMGDAVHGDDGYARHGYREMQGPLFRGDLDKAPQAVQDRVAALDKVIGLHTLEADAVVHRGTGAPRSTIPGFKPEGGNLGLTWTHHPFVSTSARPEIAEEFARGHNASRSARTIAEDHPTMIRMLVPKGTKAAKLTGMYRYEDEAGEHAPDGYAEVLLPRGLKHTIVADHGVIDGVHHIDVEVSPGD